MARQLLTDAALASIEKTDYGKHNGLIQRLCRSLRAARSALLDLQNAANESEQRSAGGAGEEKAYDGREKVLVLLHPDGWCEVYGEKWLDVKLIELRCDDDPEQRVNKLADEYRRLAWPGKLRAMGYPKFIERPRLTLEGIEKECGLRLNEQLFNALEKATNDL